MASWKAVLLSKFEFDTDYFINLNSTDLITRFFVVARTSKLIGTCLRLFRSRGVRAKLGLGTLQALDRSSPSRT